ncbi:hypothetical protein [Streptomyces sp. MZ04]|uniref:hypothetical protein n=1 Tax=Streptomyces sp. MZ04 TaxID=2559236 RepID=UPI00107EA202|nr:hypothetical protein [Streptomyces sp. MZ04]TGA92505.1 hypothetical protein E2651_37000 [Streptomyces sp. MZ04]
MIVLVAVLLLLAAVSATVLLQAWPQPASPGGNTERVSRTRILIWNPRLARDTRLFLVVFSIGGLGSLIHVLRSAYEYVGNRRLRRSWFLMYLLEPLVGASLALVVYCVLRGGLTTSVASSGDINPYGVASVAALVGMFSRQTVDKLSVVFNTLLTPPRESTDQLVGPAAAPPAAPVPGTGQAGSAGQPDAAGGSSDARSEG